MLLIQLGPPATVQQSSVTVTVPSIGVYLPSDVSIRGEFGSAWTSIGLRNRPDWNRRDVVYSPDIRLINAPRDSNAGNTVSLLPVFWRATLQLGQTTNPVKYAIFAEAGVIGVLSAVRRSRFVASPATGIGFTVSRNRFDVEAQYIQPLMLDNRDFTGFCISFGYRL